jgi:hypothetical protein
MVGNDKCGTALFGETIGIGEWNDDNVVGIEAYVAGRHGLVGPGNEM